MLRVLGSRIDTLEASFKGQVSEDLIEALERAKRQAQAEEVPQPFVIGERSSWSSPRASPSGRIY